MPDSEHTFRESWKILPVQAEARAIFSQIFFAVDHMHRNGWIHRDIKCENVLLADPFAKRVLLADFGFAGRYSNTEPQRVAIGSLSYAAPEICSGRAYFGPEVDIWSLGVLLYALVVGKLPFASRDPHQLTCKIVAGEFLLPEWLTPACANLLRAMLSPQPEFRATADYIRCCDWFLGLSPPVLPIPLRTPEARRASLESLAAASAPRLAAKQRRESLPFMEGAFHRVVAGAAHSGQADAVAPGSPQSSNSSSTSTLTDSTDDSLSSSETASLPRVQMPVSRLLGRSLFGSGDA